jgi:dolichol-phosphate mannosyltransferase
MSVMVVIPTYDEASNIVAMVEALCALPALELDVLVVDDNSPDGTGLLVDQLRAQLDDARRLHVLHRTRKEGLGAAYIAGFKYALAQGAEQIIQMDADFSHSPSYIPQMLEAIRQYDVVVGSRYVRGGKVDERWSPGRFFLSWWANSVWVNLVLRLKVRDATAGFKCWQRRVLEEIELDQVRSNGYDFQVEMAYLTERLGFRVLEIPIYFEDRRIGKSKMSIPVKFEAAYRVLEIRWRHRFGRGAIARVDQKRETI